MRIVIVDYGAGNIRSVERAVAHCGHCATISGDPAAVDSADVVIVPGVGAAADTMRNLRERSLVEPIRSFVASGRPYLGICMGLQALLTASEEGGEHACLDIIPGRVLRLPAGLKVPHMGWNQVRRRRPHSVFDGIRDDAYFYFVHSYYPAPDDGEAVIGETDYGVTFASALARDNVIATQFHPEKSGDVGLRFYRNFLEWAAGRKVR
jgi:glutamine amidotransferase